MFESVRSVRAGWIGFGWFIAVALTSVVLLGLIWLGVIQPEAPTEGLGVAVAILFGFLVAGFFVGTRVNAAPILHGVGMGLVSVIVWLALNLFAGEPTDAETWSVISPGVALGLLALQTAAAAVGARAGVRFARRAAAIAG